MLNPMASVGMSFICTSRTQIFSTTPPRPRVVLKRSPTSVPRNVHRSTRMFRTPPDISLPTVNPPWPWYTMQSAITTSSVGRPRFRPYSSFPDLMQMASSPTSNRQL